MAGTGQEYSLYWRKGLYRKENMKAIIIGDRKRYEIFMPSKGLPEGFMDEIEKVYFPLGTKDEEIIGSGEGAEFLLSDAIAPVSGYLIDHLPDLKLIHSEGVAYNGIDIEAASKRGITVCNNRGINATAVAEQTIMLMLGLLRSIKEGDEAVRGGHQIDMKHRKMREGILELADCQVGLIGFGDIARATAKMLITFGCSVVYCARSRKEEGLEREYQASYMEMDELLATSDIVSLHVPVNDGTRGMADKGFFCKMKPSAYLINTSRGEIVDNEALLEALREHEIAGAGLDTVAPEPVPADHILINAPKEAAEKILFSPHIGGITTSTFRRGHMNMWKAVWDVSEGRKPKNVIV